MITYTITYKIYVYYERSRYKSRSTFYVTLPHKLWALYYYRFRVLAGRFGFKMLCLSVNLIVFDREHFLL